jgi:hypothetical protein
VGLWADPRYRTLAGQAALELGSSSSAIVKAILAQWQCEIGNAVYPPPRNNPGNNAKGWADGTGIRYTVQTPNPQPGNPIVTFAHPEDGARSYALGLRNFGRYAAARLAVARGDGQGFLVAVCAAGYGTNADCALGVLRSEGGAIPAPIAAPHHGARVTVRTQLWNDGTHAWRYALQPGQALEVRGALYAKGGVSCYPVSGPAPFAGYYVPAAHVALVS